MNCRFKLVTVIPNTSGPRVRADRQGCTNESASSFQARETKPYNCDASGSDLVVAEEMLTKAAVTRLDARFGCKAVTRVMFRASDRNRRNCVAWIFTGIPKRITNLGGQKSSLRKNSHSRAASNVRSIRPIGLISRYLYAMKKAPGSLGRYLAEARLRSLRFTPRL